MNDFSCAHCGSKFQVRPELPVGLTCCPTCKNLLLETPGTTVAEALPHLEERPSSLARAGVAAEFAESRHGATDKDDPARPDAKVLAAHSDKAQRYLLEGEIARGGMGAVLRAVDRDIQREVAVKYLLDQVDSRKKARFVKEAQITGQLEHPNIVPIHELGVDAQGSLFFAMKMVRGRSLQQVLENLCAAPRTAEKEYSLDRLLTIFINICHALAYAHSRGVVHRDLKPANVMIGDFGEVYVMDWGLAKLLSRAVPAEAPAVDILSTVSFVRVEEKSAGVSSGMVKIDRSSQGDKTVDGTVMGTALYMPPEQARGDIGAIDERSDIYSLGALLYEMLTLQPPVDKTGGIHAALRRVIQGEIVAPEKRVLERARKIPPELSAVAMKALAKEKKDRYPTVEALRHDIELYREGRSVSAREDTRREMVWKLIKRNKGFSAGMAAALLVLLGSLWFIGMAWLQAEEAREKAENNYNAYQREQQDKQARTTKAVPALVQAARLSARDRALDDALVQLDLAQSYDPDYPTIDLVRGQVLIGKLDFTAASEALRNYLKRQPSDADAKELVRLCQQARAEDCERLLALADVLLGQKSLGAANCLIEAAGKLGQKREALLPLLRKRLEASFPGVGNQLSVEKDGSLRLYLNGPQARDLTPLKRMPLTWLSLDKGGVTDLAPLEGMPLTSLQLQKCKQVSDLSPLVGMPLTSLELTWNNRVQDLSPLRGMPLTRLDLSFDNLVQDLSPLRNMPLTWLNLTYTKVHDLSPLRDMPLTSLILGYNDLVHDVSPLKGMPLTFLDLNWTQVEDLSPLRGMPLTGLSLGSCSQVHDLSPLVGMPLSEITLPPQVDRGMDVLRQLKTLKNITSSAGSLAADEFWKKYDAGEFPQYKK